MSLETAPADELTAPCWGKGELFDSVMGGDHNEAKALCATCPIPLFAACQELVSEQQWPEGTWAGRLYENGTVVKDGGYRVRRKLIEEHTREVAVSREVYLRERSDDEGWCRTCRLEPRDGRYTTCRTCRNARRRGAA